jgi:AGZA family xanthine/uracil permease-like MFS transporter
MHSSSVFYTKQSKEKNMVKVLDNYFSITSRGSKVSKELIGGLITFLSMMYILALQPSVMSAAGMEASRVFTTTALTAGVATLVMAFLGKLPIALASGLGINTFIAFNLCAPVENGGLGFHWQMAILAVFIEGILFIVLSVTGIREKIIKGIPNTMKKAVALGIGLFIAFIGLADAGILQAPNGMPIMGVGKLGPTAIVAIISLILMIVLYTKKVPGSIIIAIIIATLAGIPLGITTAPAVSVAAPYTPVDIIKGIAGGSFNFMEFVAAFLSMLMIDMFDTLGTFAGLAETGNLKDEKGDIINQKQGLLSDAIGTVFGSMFGATTVTSYIESGSGIGAGARTGLASVVTGVLFLLCIPLYGIIGWIPTAAVSACLIFVGFLMLGSISNLNLHDIDIGLPTFITMLMIAGTYSISQGLAWGFVSYILVMVFSNKTKEIQLPTWVLSAIFILYLILKYIPGSIFA